VSHIYKDASGRYLVAGKGHSWGSFETYGAAERFIRETEEADRTYRERCEARRREIAARIDREQEEWLRAREERLAADRELYRER